MLHVFHVNATMKKKTLRKFYHDDGTNILRVRHTIILHESFPPVVLHKKKKNRLSHERKQIGLRRPMKRCMIKHFVLISPHAIAITFKQIESILPKIAFERIE